MSGLFKCKQFKVAQDGVAMRINTDGVLLGAWVSLPQSLSGRSDAPKALDIGAGSGVIALMLAQRLSAAHPSGGFLVDALEPHSPSAQTALENFNHGPWASCMQLFNSTLQDYVKNPPMYKYDLMVSNPPFFEDSLRPPEQERCLVRHTDSLPYADLIQGVVSLLHPLGCFGLILPTGQQDRFIELSNQRGLFCRKQTLLYTLPQKAPKRVLMEFTKKKEPLQSDLLGIHKADGKSYTDEYMKLTGDFYLAF